MIEKKEHPSLKLLDSKIEKESQRLLKKNTLILKLLNDIGSHLDNDFNPIKEFDMEAHFETLGKLINYFLPLCKDKMNKRIPLHLIFIIIIKIDDLNQHFEELINYIMEIFLADDYSKIQHPIFKTLINEVLKYCLKEDQFSFVINYSKKFVGDILILFNILVYCFDEDENNFLLRQVIRNLKIKYEKVIILDSILDAIEIKQEKYIGLLNQLLELDYDNIDRVQILKFKDFKFQLEEPSNEELNLYFGQDSNYKKTEKSKKHSNKKSKKKKEKTNASNDSNTAVNKISSDESLNINLSPQNDASLALDVNKMSKTEQYLYNELNKVKNELFMVKSELKTTNDKLTNTNNKLTNTDNELQKMKKSNDEMKMTVDSLNLELKKVKIRSLFKGIIDIFCSVYGLNLKDNYYNKLNSLLLELEELTQNNKIIELKDFLTDVYYYLQRGNCLAHLIKENSTPLEMIFPLIEKESKRDYSNTKKILSELSFNKTLNYALNNYYSLKDKKKMTENINFSLKELENHLL